MIRIFEATRSNESFSCLFSFLCAALSIKDFDYRIRKQNFNPYQDGSKTKQSRYWLHLSVEIVYVLIQAQTTYNALFYEVQNPSIWTHAQQ